MRLTRNVVVGAVAMAAAASSAHAQQVRFAGSTLGCFHVGVATACTPVAASSLAGDLTFTAGTFDIFTDPTGIAGVSYGAIGIVSPANSLGTVASAGAFSASGDQYLRLRITFATPFLTGDINDIAGDNVFDVVYHIAGSSQQANVGGIHFIPVGGLVGSGIVFDPINNVLRTGNLYTGAFTSGDVFPQGPGGGTATGVVNYHTLDTRSITAGGSASLTSFLQIESAITSVPEPATLALMATGIAGVGGIGAFGRRKRR